MPKNNHIISLACFFVIYAYSSLYLGLPAYPMLQAYFHTSVHHIKFSLTLFLLGYACSQFVWGALSDRYGRKKIIILALSIAIFGSIITALAKSVCLFFAGRLIESLGAGFSMVMVRATLADVLEKNQLRVMMTYLVAIAAIMPSIAPIIGGQILHWLNWQSIYLFSAVLGILLLTAICFYLEETHTRLYDNKAESTKPVRALYVYMQLFRQLSFLRYFLSFCFILSGLISFYAMAPYIFIVDLGILPHFYGYLLIIISTSYFSGSFLARFLANKFNTNRVFYLGYCLIIPACLVFILLTIIYTPNTLTIIAPMSIYAIGCGLISPTANACALSALEENRGCAAALLGGGVIAFSGIWVGLLAILPVTGTLPLAVVICFLGIGSLTTFLMLHRTESDTIAQ